MRNLHTPTWVNGFGVECDTIQIYPASSELNYRAAAGGHWTAITIEEEAFQRAALRRLGRPLPLPVGGTASYPVPRAQHQALDRAVSRLTQRTAVDARPSNGHAAWRCTKPGAVSSSRAAEMPPSRRLPATAASGTWADSPDTTEPCSASFPRRRWLVELRRRSRAIPRSVARGANRGRPLEDAWIRDEPNEGERATS